MLIRKKWKLIVVTTLSIILVSGLLHWMNDDGFQRADAVFVDVGQGDCLHIRSQSGKSILIDGGGKESFDVGKRIVKPYLLKNGVRQVDLAIVTHLDTDHFGGIRSLAEDGMIKQLGLYAGNHLMEAQILEATGLRSDQMVYCKAGDRITIDDSTWLEFLYPEEKSSQQYQMEIQEDNENPRSLVVRVHLGQSEILMTGDIDTATEQEILWNTANHNSILQSVFLKIAHHGSKYSTSDEFLEMVAPKVAVFQTGTNNYGHPDSSIIEKCLEKGIMVYRTDLDGAIGLFGLFRQEPPLIRRFKEENPLWPSQATDEKSTHLSPSEGT